MKLEMSYNSCNQMTSQKIQSVDQTLYIFKFFLLRNERKNVRIEDRKKERKQVLSDSAVHKTNCCERRWIIGIIISFCILFALELLIIQREFV